MVCDRCMWDRAQPNLSERREKKRRKKRPLGCPFFFGGGSFWEVGLVYLISSGGVPRTKRIYVSIRQTIRYQEPRVHKNPPKNPPANPKKGKRGKKDTLIAAAHLLCLANFFPALEIVVLVEADTIRRWRRVVLDRERSVPDAGLWLPT